MTFPSPALASTVAASADSSLQIVAGPSGTSCGQNGLKSSFNHRLCSRVYLPPRMDVVISFAYFCCCSVLHAYVITVLLKLETDKWQWVVIHYSNWYFFKKILLWWYKRKMALAKGWCLVNGSNVEGTFEGREMCSFKKNRKEAGLRKTTLKTRKILKQDYYNINICGCPLPQISTLVWKPRYRGEKTF